MSENWDSPVHSQGTLNIRLSVEGTTISLAIVSLVEAGVDDTVVRKGGRYAFCPAEGSIMTSGGDMATLISRVEFSSTFVGSVVARDECNKESGPEDKFSELETLNCKIFHIKGILRRSLDGAHSKSMLSDPDAICASFSSI